MRQVTELKLSRYQVSGGKSYEDEKGDGSEAGDDGRRISCGSDAEEFVAYERAEHIRGLLAVGNNIPSASAPLPPKELYNAASGVGMPACGRLVDRAMSVEKLALLWARLEKRAPEKVGPDCASRKSLLSTATIKHTPEHERTYSAAVRSHAELSQIARPRASAIASRQGRRVRSLSSHRQHRLLGRRHLLERRVGLGQRVRVRGVEPGRLRRFGRRGTQR